MTETLRKDLSEQEGTGADLLLADLEPRPHSEDVERVGRAEDQGAG